MRAEFDQFAQTYREQQTEGHSFLTGEDSHYFARLKAEKLKEWLPQYFTGTPKNILDFGCGDGLMTEEVRLQFPNSAIHGVDNSEESIKIARKNHPEVHYYLSTDNLSMFPSNTFDILIATHVFHHISFQEHEHYIQELVRVLRKDGILVS